jgi:uncharacterized membrane protein
MEVRKMINLVSKMMLSISAVILSIAVLILALNYSGNSAHGVTVAA